MKTPPLSPVELEMTIAVFRRHPSITRVTLFGSRAKGTHKPSSDVDLAVAGEIDLLQSEEIASELDELPLPYRWDVVPFSSIKDAALREHIERVGVSLYSASR